MRLAPLILLGALALPLPASASPEYQAKAAFLFNFGKFVQWPDAAFGEGEMRLCVLGADPFGAALDGIEGKQVRGQKLVVLRGPGVDPRRCHILFIARSEDGRLDAILQAVGRSSVLTVGESEDFARRGGVVNFKIVDGKIRFEINPEAAKQAGLRISAKLLQLATVVSAPT